MKTKYVKIQINDKIFPELYNIKDELLGSKCYEIFEAGYKLTYPDIDNALKNSTEHMHTDLIKHEINKLNVKIDNNEMNGKISAFTDVVQDLFGINYNSTRKGKIAEDFIYNLIISKFKDYTIEITRHKPHHGDGIIKIPCNKNEKIMLEIKNYTTNIDNDELDKLLYDMKYTNVHYSVFLSLRSSFVGKKRLEINSFLVDDVNYTIVFVPYALKDSNRVENALILIERLMDLDKQKIDKIDYSKLYKNVNCHLQEIDSIYSKLGELKSHYLKTETNIKQHLSDHYKIMREYELHTKATINKVWYHIQLDFEKYKKEILATEHSDNVISMIDKIENKHKLQNLRGFIELFNKYGIYIAANSCDIETDQCWSLMDNDNKIVGNILKNKNIIEINLTHPTTITLLSTRDKVSFSNTICTLEKILSY